MVSCTKARKCVVGETNVKQDFDRGGGRGGAPRGERAGRGSRRWRPWRRWFPWRWFPWRRNAHGRLPWRRVPCGRLPWRRLRVGGGPRFVGRPFVGIPSSAGGCSLGDRSVGGYSLAGRSTARASTAVTTGRAGAGGSLRGAGGEFGFAATAATAIRTPIGEIKGSLSACRCARHCSRRGAVRPARGAQTGSTIVQSNGAICDLRVAVARCGLKSLAKAIQGVARNIRTAAASCNPTPIPPLFAEVSAPPNKVAAITRPPPRPRRRPATAAPKPAMIFPRF